MDGARVVIEGRTRVKQVTEHWPPGTRSDGPSDYSVPFYDPQDPDQWVCNCRSPTGEADLSPGGLLCIFKRASFRSWRDHNGVYWRICTCPIRQDFGSEGDEDAVGNSISFRRRDEHGTGVIRRDVRVLRRSDI